MDINTFNKLRGLKASDRTAEEQQAVNQVMGYKEQPIQENIKIQNTNTGLAPTKLPQGAKLGTAPALAKQPTLADKIKAMAPEYAQMTELYKEGLAESGAKFGIGRNSVSSNASDYLDKVSNEVSSYYKKYKGTDKLSDQDLNPTKVKTLAMEYQAREKAYGKDAAAYWLDKQYKEIVANNQSWMEQAWNGFSHLVPSIEGGAVELAGNIWGTINPIVSLIDSDLELPQNENMGFWHNYLNNVIDNPVTRLGHDIERAGASYAVQSLYHMIDPDSETADERIASMKNSATKYNPEGIGSDAIVLTEDQENSIISSATPWEAMQSSGFTTLSMLTGFGLAGVSKWSFGLLTKGANYLNKAGKILKTTEGLEKALVGIKKAQNATNMFIVPGLTGGVEGMQEGLNTKIQVEQDGVQKLNDYYKEKIDKEAAEIYAEESKKPKVMTEVKGADGSKRMVQTGGKSYAQVYKEVFDKYQEEYLDARKQIEFAASEAGVHNFYANSLINGMLNMTLKAGLQSDRVQETLRNSKLLGWAYKKPKFTINADGTVKPKFTKLGAIGQYIKEPIGEGMEEFAQSLSNDTFAGAAGNNIDEFIKRRFSGDGNVQVGDMFASDYGAAWSSFLGSWTKADTWKSAVLGAVGSVMGSASMAHRGYKRDENGNLVKGGYWGRQLKADGTQETAFEAVARMTPWRSGMVNSYFDRKREIQEAEKAAEHIQEWLQDPKNQAKWDGLVGTASWMNEMHNAAQRNDQFGFRNAQMGKAINDAIMLSQLEGTDLYETIMADLKRSSEMDVTSQEGQSIIEQMRNSGNEEFQNKTDEEVIDKIKSNANKMLGIMSQVEENGNYFDRLLGRVDENTKHSLIFGKMMEKNFAERKEALEQEIDRVKSQIKNSRGASRADLEEDLKSLIIKYGSIKQAMNAEESLKDKKEKAEKRKEELDAIGKDKLTDKQKEELEAKNNEIKTIGQQLNNFTGLHEKDEKGRDTGKGRMDLATLVLNEQEIMDLDNATRAMMLAQGAAKYYNATHQNRQKVDELNLQIDEIQKKIDTLEEQKKKWIDEDGNVRKGHNKQVQRNDKAIEQLEKDKFTKMRELDTEKGETENTKNVYSEAQQAVIDNLMQQAQSVDEDFLDKAVDIAKLENGVKGYHQQLQSILSDPKAFSNYVERVKFNTAQDLLRRRAERAARIEDYKEFSRELDKLMSGASEIDMMNIMSVMRENDRKIKEEDAKQKESERIDRIINGEEDSKLTIDENGNTVVEEGTPIEELETNWDRYKKNQENQSQLINQFAKNTHLTDNDMSLLVDAMQYLAQEGIDVTDRENAVEALLEKDEQGNIGGKLRQWVEEKNASVPENQRTFMPQFTSIGQVVNDYVELLNGVEMDRIDKSNANTTVTLVDPEDNSSQPEVTSSPTSPFAPSQTAEIQSPQQEGEKAEEKTGKSIFDVGYDSPNGGQFVDNDGTVSQESTVRAEEERSRREEENTERTPLEEAFLKITTPEIAKYLRDVDHYLENTRLVTNEGDITLTDKEKGLAIQYLQEIAVNSDDRIDTLDELVTAIQGKSNELQDIQNKMEDDNNKEYGHVASALRMLATNIQVASKKRTLGPTQRKTEPMSSTMSTSNIAYIQSQDPEAWPVRFTDEHGIDEWLRDNVISSDTPVYFMVNEEWADESQHNMDNNPEMRNYSREADLPVVAAVEVGAPKNPDTTTAIKVGEKWYQPIGVMPSTTNKHLSGAARMKGIRSRVPQGLGQGTHLITENGLSGGKPLVTKVAGKKYLHAHHPDSAGQRRRTNNKENNHDLVGTIIDTLPIDARRRLAGLSKAELISNPEYQEAREKFLNRVSWSEDKTGSQAGINNEAVYTPDDLKHNEGRPSDTSAQPIVIFRRDMDVTTARESNQTLDEVLKSGDKNAVVTFNSRTQRLFNEVIRPLFQYNPHTDKTGDRSAQVIEASNHAAVEAEEKRLAKLLNGYDKAEDGKKKNSDGSPKHNDTHNFVYFKGSGWSFLVAGREEENAPTSQYDVYLVNDDPDVQPVALGTIDALQQENMEAAKDMLAKFLDVCVNGELKGRAKWQLPSTDINNLNNRDSDKSSKARRNIGAIVDDGILELGGSSLVYDTEGIDLRSPINNDGKPAYSVDRITNKDNAKPSAPMDATPQGQGSTVTNDGKQVDPDSGANLDDNNKPSKPKPSTKPQETEAHKRARAVVEKIVADSKEFVLSSDDTHYYVEDKATGQRTKYLRVTTVIGADESVSQWFPTAENLAEKLGIGNLDESLASIINDLQRQDSYVKGRIEAIEKVIDLISKKQGVGKEQVRKAIAELRTEHKKTAYGVWSTPSTTIGNTADTIVRDFFAGKVKDSYPNITKEVLGNFIRQLEFFKGDLETHGITLVSEGVMAHGNIKVTDNNGKVRQVDVAGTLDLFGYDNNGNFYIFDMKTKHDATEQKLEYEKKKWSRQVSMYADLLKQSYQIDIRPENLRIIPISVGYPNPKGAERRGEPAGPEYSTTNEGQLQMKWANGTVQDFIQTNSKGFTMMRNSFDNLFMPGYTPFSINWDNLSSEDQEIAESLSKEVSPTDNQPAAPRSAEVEKPERRTLADTGLGGKPHSENSKPVTPAKPAPITPAGTQQENFSWSNLSQEEKEHLVKLGWLESTEDEQSYNDILNDPANKEALENDVRCLRSGH